MTKHDTVLADLMSLLDAATRNSQRDDIDWTLVHQHDEDHEIHCLYLDRIDRIGAALGAIAILLARKDEEAAGGWEAWQLP